MSAKCYYLEGESSKMKHKGVQKYNKYVRKQYETALFEHQDISAINRGFKMNPGGQIMSTYELRKTGLRYAYFKRRILANSVDTEPLDL